MFCKLSRPPRLSFFFFLKDTAPTEIYTLPLHDALPIWNWAASSASKTDFPDPVFPRMSVCPTSESWRLTRKGVAPAVAAHRRGGLLGGKKGDGRSEEHTSELQSQSNLVCRLLLEKKKKT